MTMHARLDADMAAILGLEETFFLPARPAPAVAPRGQVLAVVAAIAVAAIGAVLFVRLPSSTPVPAPAADVASRRSLPSRHSVVAPASSSRRSAAPAARQDDALSIARSAEPTIRPAMRSSRRASGTQHRLTSERNAPASPAMVEPRPITSAPTSHQALSRVAQSADKSADIALPAPLADAAVEPGPAQKHARRATERRNAIDAIRALRR